MNYPNPEDKIKLTESMFGDLHSNASVNSDFIDLNKELLEHHEGHEEEILAIVGHELGHWKDSDIYWWGFWDVVYMTIVGYFFQITLNNPYLFKAFGFT